MGTWQVYSALQELARMEFADIVVDAEIMLLSSGDPARLRLTLIDASFLDVHLSLTGRYSYHWDRRLVSGHIYRHDNAPHSAWLRVSTYPKHFHNGVGNALEESYISGDPPSALREFLVFAQGILRGTL